MSFIGPAIEVEPLPRTGAREDFAVRAIGPGDVVYSFQLSITYTALGIWQVEGLEAAVELAGVLADIHGTAKAIPVEGFWFDSYNSADSLNATQNRIRNRGYEAFLHPAARTSLGVELLDLIDGLDEISLSLRGRPFTKALDILFEPTQAIEDLESTATDRPHFIYRICILSAMVDRFDFPDKDGSLNGLTNWLQGIVGPESAAELTRTYRMVKRLRRQYPIHEEYEVDADGERTRRRVIVEAEEYVGLTGDPAKDWKRVLDHFRQATQVLNENLQKL